MTSVAAAIHAERPAPRVAAALVVAIVLLGLPTAASQIIALLVYLPYALVGALLAILRPRNLIGWLLIGIGWGLLFGFQPVPVTAETLRNGTAGPLVMLIAWVKGWSWLGAFGLFVIVTVLFPAGHMPKGRWRGGLRKEKHASARHTMGAPSRDRGAKPPSSATPRCASGA